MALAKPVLIRLYWGKKKDEDVSNQSSKRGELDMV